MELKHWYACRLLPWNGSEAKQLSGAKQVWTLLKVLSYAPFLRRLILRFLFNGISRAVVRSGEPYCVTYLWSKLVKFFTLHNSVSCCSHAFHPHMILKVTCSWYGHQIWLSSRRTRYRFARFLGVVFKNCSHGCRLLNIFIHGATSAEKRGTLKHTVLLFSAIKNYSRYIRVLQTSVSTFQIFISIFEFWTQQLISSFICSMYGADMSIILNLVTHNEISGF